MREQLVQKLLAAGYDADELEQMNDQDLLNEVTKIEGTTPEDAISKQHKEQQTQDPNADEDIEAWAVAQNMHPDDKAYFDAMTPGEKTYLKTFPNTPGGQERMQFIRSTPEDRASIMGRLNQADEEAYKTQGQGVKTETEIKPPLSPEVLQDTQTSAQEAAKLPPPNIQTNTQINGRDWDKIGAKIDGIQKPTIDPKNRYKLKGIWDAYDNKEIDKDSRNYLAIDAIAKGLRGIGKDISNVGAAYTGGAIQDSTPEESLWQKRNEEMMKSGIESEKATVSGSREQRAYDQWAAEQMAREFNNLSAQERIKMANIVEKYAQKAPNDTVRVMYMNIANKMLSGGTVDEKDLAITGAGELWNFISGLMN